MLNKFSRNDCVGKVFSSNSFGDFKVLEYVGHNNVLVEFIDAGYQTRVFSSQISAGNIKDFLKPNVFGVGYLGLTGVTSDSNGRSKEYILWNSMLQRCYSDVRHKSSPNYVGCSVSDYFKNFSNFYDWCQTQIGFKNKDELGNYFALDKDLLGCGKIYSEDNCVFLPEKLNAALVRNVNTRGDLPIGVTWSKKDKRYMANCSKYGKLVYSGSHKTVYGAFLLYKKAREEYVNELAEKYKDVVDPRVYDKLMKYTVNYDD